MEVCDLIFNLPLTSPAIPEDNTRGWADSHPFANREIVFQTPEMLDQGGKINSAAGLRSQYGGPERG